MGDYDGYDDDYDNDEVEDTGPAPRGLREALKARDKELRALKSQLKERDEKIATFESASRKQSVGEILTAKGVNPKVSALIPSDIEPTEAGIAAWLTEFGDALNISTGTQKAEGEDGAADATLQEEDDPEAAKLAAEWRKSFAASDGQAPNSVQQLAAAGIGRAGETSASFAETAKALSGLPGFHVADYTS